MLKELTLFAGFAGALLSLFAYIPQIYHLIKEKCSAAISVKAYFVWLIATILLLTHALSIRSIVFCVFEFGSAIAILAILYLSHKYQNRVCSHHKTKK